MENFVDLPFELKILDEDLCVAIKGSEISVSVSILSIDKKAELRERLVHMLTKICIPDQQIDKVVDSFVKT